MEKVNKYDLYMIVTIVVAIVASYAFGVITSGFWMQ